MNKREGDLATRTVRQYFLGRVVLVHKKDGSKVGGVLELLSGWDKAGFEWPTEPRSMENRRACTWARNKRGTAKLGAAKEIM